MRGNEVRSLTLKEYERISIGREEAKAEQWQYIRAIETAFINYGGMGTKKYVPETEIRPLPLIDNKFVIMPIRTIEQAYTMLDKFIKWRD